MNDGEILPQVVTRSPRAAWVALLAALPFLALGWGLLSGAPFLRAVGEALYGSSGPPAYEPRELVWGSAFLVGGMVVAGWALKELIRPRRRVVVDEEGLGLAVGPPGTPPLRLPWGQVVRVTGRRVAGRPVLAVVVKDPSQLPSRPWGARWADRWTLVVEAGGWNVAPEELAEHAMGVRGRVEAG